MLAEVDTDRRWLRVDEIASIVSLSLSLLCLRLGVWQTLYPGEVHSVRVVREVGRLSALLPKLDALRHTLDRMEGQAAKLREGAGSAGEDGGGEGGGKDSGGKGGGGKGGGLCGDGRAKALAKLEAKAVKQKAKVGAVEAALWCAQFTLLPSRT